MLENLLSKKNTKGVALLGIAAFSFLLLISAIVYFTDYGFNILIITSSFETAIGAFTGSHGYVLEKLVEHVNGNIWYLILLIIYSEYSGRCEPIVPPHRATLPLFRATSN